jgi:hypothetical protein
MRSLTLAVVTLAFMGSMGCGQSAPQAPPPTAEQVQAMEQWNQTHDPRFHAINARLGTYKPDTEQDLSDWIDTTVWLVQQYNVRLLEDGHESAITWYEKQSHRPVADLIAEATGK